ncbi:MAG: HNH endonuclease [Rhodoferax sp.]|nr:HNH endonuclease [Rhodoferax sp.]
MRPVHRGPAPAAAFANYRDAATPLMTALGDYCSYCERHIPTHMAVEHIQPKSLAPALLTSWTNFLLACVNCNSCKGHVPIALADYLWPDTDNTLRAFDYKLGGLMEPAVGIGILVLAKAQSTIRLLGLDKYPGNPNPARQPTDADLRWQHRRQLWDFAEKAKARLLANDSVELREQITDSAVLRGSFGIWFTVLGFDADMRQRLINGFCGTSTNCFDATATPIPRPGGVI